MRKSATKLTAMLMAGVMAAMSAGCGSSKTEESGTNNQQNTASSQEDKGSAENSAENKALGDKTVIEYWHVNAEQQGGLTVDELVKKFNEENDHIEVVAKYNPDMYKGLMQNLQAEAATGNTPAIVQIGWAFLDYFSENFDYISPDELLKQYGSDEDQTFFTDNFLPNVMQLAVNTKGEQVGVPYSVSSPVLFINRDLLKEAGLSEDGPQTWEEVAEFAKTIKEKTGKYGFYMQEPADFWAQEAIIESNGADMLKHNDDGTTEATFATDEGIEAMQLLADMIKDGSALHVSWDEGCQSFIDGNCAMLYTTIARRASIQNGAKFDAAAIKSPVWEGKERRVPAGGCFLAVTAATDEQRAAAWEFEKYLYSIESMAAWTEGTGYVPPRKDVADAENGLKSFLAENEMMTPAIEQMDGVIPWPSFPGDAGLEAEQDLLDMRDQILGGSASAKDGMTKTQDAINELLKAQN